MKTENKIMQGTRLEGEAYSKLTYEYKNGLLINEYVFDGNLSDGYYIKKYIYEYY